MRKRTRRSLFNYAVGYGRPPASSQFKRGQSGNPRGRPKGARNASSMASDELDRALNVKEKGKWRKTTVRKAAYRRLAEKAVAGDAKALDFLLELERAERPSESEHAQTEPLSATDLELLQRFFDRRRASVPQEGQPDARKQQRSDTERDNQ
jgi:hypothetical protein